MLDGAHWRGAIDRYVRKLRTRRKLIVAANKKFGDNILLAFFGFVLVLLAASAFLLVWAEAVLGDVPLIRASSIVTANFVKVISYYTNACPLPAEITGGPIVSAISIFHKYAITTIASGLLPFFLVFFRRPSIFSESLREAETHIRALGSGDDAGYERLRDLLKKEMQSDERQEEQERRLSLEGEHFPVNATL